MSDPAGLPQPADGPDQIARLRRALARERAARRQAEDIAERHLRDLWEGRRDSDLLGAIAGIANESGQLTDALAASLAVLGEYLRADIGHALMVVDIASPLESSGVWWERTPGSTGALRVATATVAWTRGVGLPGDVWESGRPRWIDDLSAAAPLPRLYPRRGTWQRLGLRSAVALPVFAGDDVVAVLEFFAVAPRIVSSAVEPLLVQVGTQLGRIVERSRDEHAIERRATRRTAEIIAARDAATPGGRADLELAAAGDAVLARHLRGEGGLLTADQAADLADDLAALVTEQTRSADTGGHAVEDLATALAKAAMAADVTVHIDRLDEGAPVPAAERIATAVVRLCARTADLRTSMPPVRIGLHRTPGHLVLETTGLGLGEMPEVRHRVPLALLRSAVRPARGRLETPHAGGEVLLWFPDQDVAAVPSAGPTAVRRAAVLLVLTSDTQRLIGRAVLEGLGARVESAQSVAAALEIAASGDLDLVLLDDAVPGGGFASAAGIVAAAATAGAPPLVAGLVTRRSEAVLDRAGRAGITTVLELPLGREDAADLLEQLHR